jgi:hypothetical protein
MAYPHLYVPAGDDLLQRDDDFDPDIISPGSALAASLKKTVKRAAAETAQVKPEIAAAKDLIKIDTAEKIFLRKSGDTGETSAVILFALFRIGKYSIGLSDLFELLFRIRLFVSVGMVLQSQLPEGIFDRFLVGIFTDAKYLVVVAFISRFDALPLRWFRDSPRPQPSHTAHCRRPDSCSVLLQCLLPWTVHR